MYQADTRPKSKRRRVLRRLIILLIILLLLLFGFLWIREKLKPHTVLKQAKATTGKYTVTSKITHYDEPDFGIDLPSTWHALPRPPHTYQSFTWQSSDVGTDGQQIEIFEDTIPVNFAVNRALVISGQVDHLSIDGDISDNCTTYTKPTQTIRNQMGVPAKWKDVDFLCNKVTTTRDTIGTASTDGINFVLMRSPTNGKTHKFFFTYTDNDVTPDYGAFLSALQSFVMK